LIDIVVILAVGGIVAMLIFRNINMLDYEKLEEQRDQKKESLQNNSHESLALPYANKFEKYSSFSVLIQEYIRKIRVDLEKDGDIYRLQESSIEKKQELLDLLSDALRKLTFFETLLSKSKPSTDIERDMFDILEFLDDILNEHFIDGERLADEMRDDLSSKHQQIFG
jgi:hypothetical protein